MNRCSDLCLGQWQCVLSWWGCIAGIWVHCQVRGLGESRSYVVGEMQLAVGLAQGVKHVAHGPDLVPSVASVWSDPYRAQCVAVVQGWPPGQNKPMDSPPPFLPPSVYAIWGCSSQSGTRAACSWSGSNAARGNRPSQNAPHTVPALGCALHVAACFICSWSDIHTARSTCRCHVPRGSETCSMCSAVLEMPGQVLHAAQSDQGGPVCTSAAALAELCSTGHPCSSGPRSPGIAPDPVCWGGRGGSTPWAWSSPQADPIPLIQIRREKITKLSFPFTVTSQVCSWWQRYCSTIFGWAAMFK